MIDHLPTVGASTVLRDLFDQRWSCRAFLPDQVPRKTIEEIIDVARRTPSWCNTQPWHLHITEGADTDRFREALLPRIDAGEPESPDFAFPKEYEGEYLERRRACGWKLYESVGVRRGDREASRQQGRRNFELFDAPHTAIVTSPALLGAYGAVDCGLFTQSFILAAQAVGVASVPQAALAGYAPIVKEHFGIGDDRHVVLAITFGYPDTANPVNTFRTDREESSQIVSWG